MEVKPTEETYRSYLFFWSGQLSSLFGSTVINFVLLWWITIVTNSPVIISLGFFLNFLPLVIFQPIAGVCADRFSKKKIIFIADSFQAGLTFILVLSFMMNFYSVGLVIIMNGLRGIGQAFHQPTVNSVIPSMVPEDKLSRINGINFLFAGMIQIVGSVTAGILWSIFGAQNISLMLSIDVITYFIMLIPLAIITIPSMREVSIENPTSFADDFREGISIVMKIPGLIILIVFCMFLNFLITPVNTLLSYFIHNIHGGDSTIYAVLGAIVNGGMIVGALFASIKKKWNNKARWLFVGTAAALVNMIFFSIAPTGVFLWIMIGGFMFALFMPLINTLYMTILQTAVPNDKYGRIVSIDSALSSIISPIGILISGPLGAFFGVANLFIYCAILGIILTAIIWFFTGIKHVNYDSKVMLSEEENLVEKKEMDDLILETRKEEEKVVL
ncbi:MAG: MFS transporter [Promethearchaeota archaeon]|nr:MAG: MFS transporter [Candidatus Lokiarchaeota archaeon]